MKSSIKSTFILKKNVTYHYYTAFGLTLASVIDFPNLVSGDGLPDVVIDYGEVPESLKDPVVTGVYQEFQGNVSLHNLQDHAGIRVLVSHGNRMIVERIKSTHRNKDAMQLFLLGWCMSSILSQRKLIALHGNAVVSTQGAIVLAGESGAGKSTLTAEFYQRNYKVLTDDVSAIDWQRKHSPLLLPAFPRLKLWQQTLDQFNINSEELDRIRPEIDKYHYPIDDAFCYEKQPLNHIYVIVPKRIKRACIYPINGREKIEKISQQFYKLWLQEGQKNWPWMFEAIGLVAKKVKISVIERPSGKFAHVEMADLIESDLMK